VPASRYEIMLVTLPEQVDEDGEAHPAREYGDVRGGHLTSLAP